MRWEYKMIKLGAQGFWLGGKIDVDKLDQLMDEMGRQGWELTSTLDVNRAYGDARIVMVIFKRPRK